MSTNVGVLRKENVVFDILGVICFIALTTAGAYIRIPLPFTPVPITLQTFFIMLAGAILGKRLGLLSQVGYLFVGIFGLPVFTGGLYGLARLFGPTGGYLIGFALAAYLIGWLLGKSNEVSFLGISWAMFLGEVALFATGTLWLTIVLRVSFWQGVILGVLPFIPGEIIKLFAAAVIYQRIQKPSRKLFS
jgi:biotin transport system substrate-specific component